MVFVQQRLGLASYLVHLERSVDLSSIQVLVDRLGGNLRGTAIVLVNEGYGIPGRVDMALSSTGHRGLSGLSGRLRRQAWLSIDLLIADGCRLLQMQAI